MTVIDDLAAEQDRLQSVLADLTEQDWMSPSAAAGWSIADVVLHLAQSEEFVVATIGGAGRPDPVPGETLDESMDRLVRAERAAPAQIFSRWQAARAAALTALRAADPQTPVAWVDAPLKPATLATTRLAEHWAHALDITGPLGIPYEDTARLRHIAWLAHRTLPYALALAGQPSATVYCELTAPDGVTTWQFGDPGAESSVTGAAGAFCRVAAQRLAPEESGLRTSGPHGEIALRVVRTYAA